MIKKFVAWIKALFAPAKIEDAKVDEYIAKQSQARTVSQVRFTKAETRPLDEPLEKNQVLVSVNVPENTKRVVTVETRQTVREVPVEKTPPKPLNEQLKGVELPAYAKGKTLPPKAKRQFIKQAKMSGSPAPGRRLDDTPHSTGGHVVSHGIDPVNAALYGYAAGAILSDDTPAAQPAPVEECRSSSATSTYSSSYSSSDDSYSSSSSSSYDSGSYDSGSSYSSCD
ncbi:hypothetical protein ADU18_0150 [Cronobacter phage PBES 02]|uniref:Uncharacterized protein n=1 Tax=Cronobacter phage PBES 02 TaxID=1684115 RepID=A0A0K1YAD1_9CAUD|nr:hypothetical protein ADU18_0150 [Cronobacter phage PBES 02]AKY04050.1 hypothetical protein ADU18_0150 [Cronobacter phage PBES 02]